MTPSKQAPDQPSSGGRPRIRKVQPLAPEAEPWLGVLVNPRHSPFALIMSQEDTDFYVVVRCVDPCSARGIEEGEEYLVRADYVSDET